MAFDPAKILVDTLPAATRRLCIAYSGGVDSGMLLEALSELRRQGSVPELLALHIHHGLQAQADDWAEHCATQCKRLDVPLQVLRVCIDPSDPAGPEGAARRARYAALSAAMRDGDVLATAHHLDDQAETFLMRALRGAGPRGLGAMRALQRFEPGWLWRPLLGIERLEITAWAERRGLNWIEDPHNHDPRYERSRLRQELMPRLYARWPAAAHSLARSAQWSAEADGLLTELAMQDALAVRRGSRLSIAGLTALSPARRRNLLRWWLREERALPSPPQAVLLQIDGLLLAPADADPRLAWPGAELRRYRDDLHGLVSLPPEPDGFEVTWNGAGRLPLPPGCGVIESQERNERCVSVGFARGGERFQPLGGVHRRTLKNLFQERAVPPWMRRRTPLLFEDDQLRWIGGIGPSADADAFYARIRWTADLR